MDTKPNTLPCLLACAWVIKFNCLLHCTTCNMLVFESRNGIIKCIDCIIRVIVELLLIGQKNLIYAASHDYNTYHNNSCTVHI